MKSVFPLSTAKSGKAFLEVRDVTKSYDGQTLFKNVNFTVMHGEKIAITGPNGAGKQHY